MYDVDAFTAALAGRVPENALLSHDLFEGLFARTALVTDVGVLEHYPSSVLAHGRRQHRWVRGLADSVVAVPGVTLEQATADLAGVMDRLAREYPDTNAQVGPRVRPYRDVHTSGPIRTVFAALMGAGGFLLLIGCANVANLLLARGATRAREITVRLSLGATRRRIVAQLLAESLLLALVAGAVGLALAAMGVRLFQQLITGTGEPYWLQFRWRPGSSRSSPPCASALPCCAA